MKKLSILAAAFFGLASVAEAQVSQLNKTTAQARLDNGQMIYVDFYGPNIFRLFQDPNGGILRDPQARPEAQILVDNPRKVVQISVDGREVSTGEVKVRINLADGSLDVVEGLPGGLHISAPKFNKKSTQLILTKQEGESFYGGGVQNGRFSHAGKTIAIVNTNNWVDGGVASPTPFYWSTAGYGVMGYTFAPGSYDFGDTEADKTILTHDTDYADYFFMFNAGPVALLNDFYQLTGNPVLLPKFGFYQGHLNAYNRDYWTENEKGFMAYEDGKRYNESQKDNGGVKESLNGELDNYQFSARAAIDRYLDNDMPLGWFLPNDGYGAGYGQTETLEGNVQNLKEFGDYARSKGVEIGLWTQSDLHPKEGVEALLQRDIVREVRDAGVRVLKTDVAWVGAGYSFGLNGVADVGHIMPYYGNDARPFIISLDGWAGTQRYAGIWTGDQTGGNWEYIRFHIPTYIGSGLSGQPNITSDMDGIFGGKNVPVNVRDFQWKTFTPMELNMDGWGSNPKYPQALGEPATSINRWWLKLKSRLMPYAYSIAREAVDGKPMIRAMFLEEDNAYTRGTATQYQFMFGPSILVAPIYKETKMDKEGNDIRNGIYLPQGQWVDYFTGRVYEGGQILNDFDAPLWKTPVLVKRGAIIPMHKSTNTVKEMDASFRSYDIYPAVGEYAFTEYDDDGTTQAYLGGENTLTTVSQQMDEKGNLCVTVAPTEGGFEGFQPAKSTVLNVYCSRMPKKVVAKIGKKKVALTRADSYKALMSTPNSYYFGKSDIEHMDITGLMVNLAETDITANGIELTATGVSVNTENQLLKNTGALQAPAAKAAQINAYDLTLAWDAQSNADYYEVAFGGQTYGEIRQTAYTFEDLTPETTYAFEVRAVNKDGKSEWQAVAVTTKSDPLEFAIRGIKGQTSCKNQGGQGVDRMFDFDEGAGWHTAWSEKAVPFELIADLKSVNTLDKMWYLPRTDAGNGTIQEATIAYSLDRKNWTEAGSVNWQADGEKKEFTFEGEPSARYVRISVTKARGDFGSGQELYIFRKPGSDFFIPGDINQDGKLDENDLTSYMNYTGLRQGDGDFEGYISKGDLNGNGLIDAYDISAVAVELEGGVSDRKVDDVAGSVNGSTNQATYKAGDEVLFTLTGKGLKSVNALSLCIPYDANELEYVGVEPAESLQQMYNMTYDRLHTNGQKALYPTFVNLGDQHPLEGDGVFLTIKFRAKRAGKVQLKVKDGMLVDKYMNTVVF